MNDFGKILGEILNRPHWIPVPSVALKLVLGDKSQLVLEGQRVMPDKLLTHGFKFTYPNLVTALKNIYAEDFLENATYRKRKVAFLCG